MDKETRLLNYLLRQDSWTTAKALAAAVGVSVRTVMTYIKQLRSLYPQMIESSAKGFLLADRQAAIDLLRQKPAVPQTRKERTAVIMQKILLGQKPFDLDALSDQLAISPDTLQNELKQLKPALGKYGLLLRQKANRVWIEGEEKNKKRMISSMIYENTSDFCCDIDAIQMYLPHYDLHRVSDIVKDTLLAHHFYIDDFSLTNFVLHTGITMERTLAGPAAENGRLSPAVSPHMIAIMNDISVRITDAFYVALSELDIHELSLILMTRIRTTDPDAEQDIHAILPSEILLLLEKIQHALRSVFHLNVSSPDFWLRFGLHLKNLWIRIENQIAIRNSHFSLIKESYPLMYDVAVYAADLICREWNCTLSEDEIAFIALHLGALLEEQRAIQNKIPAILVCPQYYTSMNRLAQKINDLFGKDLYLIGVAASRHETEQYHDYELILSTVPFSKAPDTPAVLITYGLANTDILAISSAVEAAKKKRMKQILEQELKYLFHENLFFVDPGSSSYIEEISYMADALYQAGYVDSRYKDRIYEREQISSSAYSNIAIPHPLHMQANKSAIAVSLHSRPLLWQGSPVNIVFMLAIRGEDAILFRTIFDYVSSILTNETYIRRLIETRSYADFIKLLVALS